MRKAYLKPNIELMEEELAQLLCTSTVIEPGEDNRPAGARESGWNFWDDEEDNPSGRGSIWDEE